jgi:hypothetical protein
MYRYTDSREGDFFVELNHSEIKLNRIKSRAQSQITLDDDCIVSDRKPDVARIIHTEGALCFDEARVAGGMAVANGRLKFTVLYRGGENQLESLEDEVRFTEKLYLDEIDEPVPVKLGGRIEDLSITAINSRKLAVRAVVGVNALCEQQTEEELVSGIEADEAVQQKKEKRKMLLLDFAGRDLLRVHREFTLPQASPNIGYIIYRHVEIRKKESALTTEGLVLSGEAAVCVLYKSTEGTDEWYETTVPFAENTEGRTEGEEPVFWLKSELSDCELEVIGDGDGEPRSFAMDLVFDVDIKVWNEVEKEILTDAYALDRTLKPKLVPMESLELLVKNEAQLGIRRQMSLSDEKERILQLCTCQGEVSVDFAEKKENALNVEGILNVHILYATTDDSFPISHICEQIPFSQLIDVPGLESETEDIAWELEPQIVRLEVNLLDREHYEIRATLLLSALVMKRDSFLRIEEIEEEPLDTESLSRQPGVIGYRVGNETLWDIAKEFATTGEQIMEINSLASPELAAGQKLVIVRGVS